MLCGMSVYFFVIFVFQKIWSVLQGKGEMFTWWLEGKRVKSSTEDRIGADGNYSAPLPPINVPNIEL